MADEWPDTEKLLARARAGESLCLYEHVIHVTDDQRQTWLTCEHELGRIELGRFDIPDGGLNESVARYFLENMMARHDRQVAGLLVAELLASYNQCAQVH